MIYRSTISVFDSTKQIQKLKNNKGVIVIFGTGNYGALALHALKKHGIAIHYFCDNNRTNWGKQLSGHTILSPDELLSSFPDAMVLIAHLQFKYMANQLRREQRIQIVHCDFLFKELDLSDIVASAPLARLIWMLDLYMFAIDAENAAGCLKIKSLDIVVTEKCTLRCKDCSNLMQFYQKPQDCEIDLLLASLDRFMSNVDALHEARILGGEPFVYKKLPELIKQLSSYDKCNKITLFTNGTIVPKDAMLESLRNDKISLIISDYGKLSKNISSLKTLMAKIEVPFITYTIDSWQDCAAIFDRKRTNKKLASLFGNCCVNDALTLLHGRLYTCPFAAHAVNLKAIPDTCDDGLDLSSSDRSSLREKIRELYSGKNFLGACAFCAGRDYEVGKTTAAIQTASPLSYERYCRQ